MKTITEFSATTLKNALKTREELTAAGKTAEELPAAMGEALKLEGEKLTLMLNALEVVEKKLNDLKRVVVWSLQEGEKAPRGTEQKGDHYFGIEFFPPMPGQERKGRGGRDSHHGKGRGDKRGGKRGRRGDRDGKGGRGPRRGGENAEGGEATQQAGAPGEGGGEGEKRRRRRRPRGPRREGAGAPTQAAQAKPSEPLKPIQPKTPIEPKPHPAPANEGSGDSNTPPASN